MNAGEQRQLGPISLAPGVPPSQIFVYLAAMVGCTIANSVLTVMQPLVIVGQLGIPATQQGQVAGFASAAQQLATLLLISSAGAWSDRAGRRLPIVLALAGFALCLGLFPLVASVVALLALRFAWGVAFTGFTAGGATKAMDYPDNASRGRFISFVLIVQGALSAVFVWTVVGPLPSWLKQAELDTAAATAWSFWIFAAIVAAFALLTRGLMHDDARRQARVQAKRASLEAFVEGSREVVRAAQDNPRLGFCLIVGIVIRSDTVVIGTFTGMWVIAQGRAAGADPIAMTATVAMLTTIFTAATFLSPLVFGILADRVDRAKLALFGLGLTIVTFCGFGLVRDPSGSAMMLAVGMAGVADGAQRIAAQALIAQEAPKHLRGAAMGLFAFVGLASIVVINFVGGLLFDRLSYAAPFVMEGIITLAILCIAVQQLRRCSPPTGRSSAIG